LAAGRWREVGELAHSLANSAFAVQDLVLSADAARLERAARRGVPCAPEVETVFGGIGRHLARSSSAPFIPGTERGG
jgi:hypothetical protein